MDCIFCSIASGDIASRIVYQDENTVAFLDMSPWQRGHTVVIPKTHGVNALESPESFTLAAAVVPTVARLLVEKLGAVGVNIVSNCGEVAGQSVFHTHIHVVPRYAEKPGMAALFGPESENDLDDLLQEIMSS